MWTSHLTNFRVAAVGPVYFIPLAIEQIHLVALCVVLPGQVMFEAAQCGHLKSGAALTISGHTSARRWKQTYLHA